MFVEDAGRTHGTQGYHTKSHYPDTAAKLHPDVVKATSTSAAITVWGCDDVASSPVGTTDCASIKDDGGTANAHAVHRWAGPGRGAEAASPAQRSATCRTGNAQFQRDDSLLQLP